MDALVSDANGSISEQNILKLIKESFNNIELRELCFTLKIDHTGFSQRNKTDFTLSLLLQCIEVLEDLMKFFYQLEYKTARIKRVKNQKTGSSPIPIRQSLQSKKIPDPESRVLALFNQTTRIRPLTAQIK